MNNDKNALSLEDCLIRTLSSDEDIKTYLNANLKDYLQDGDFGSFFRALEIAVKAKSSVEKFARNTGISRSHLYSLFKAEKEPKFSTVLKIFKELGYDLEVA